MASASGSSHAAAKTTSTVHRSPSKRRKARKTARNRGQLKIDSERCRAIQQALVREHYLSGTPSGTWDTATVGAMQRYQADNGWQSKTTPDSRALIKLGLGPDHQHLLNPESAMTTSPGAANVQHAANSKSSSPAVDPPAPAVPAQNPSPMN